MLQEGTEDGRQSWFSLENTVCPTDLSSGVAEPKVPTGTWSWVCFPSLPRSCAPPVFLTLAQVLQVISPAPQEHPKDSRMNSPFQMWKLERAPGLTARAVCWEERWVPEPKASAPDCWAALCLIYSEQKLATHTTPWSPCTTSPGPCAPFSLPWALRYPRSVCIQGLVPSAPCSEPEVALRLVYGLPLMLWVHLSRASVHVWRPCGPPTSSRSAAMSSQRLLCDDDRWPGPWYMVSLR